MTELTTETNADKPDDVQPAQLKAINVVICHLKDSGIDARLGRIFAGGYSHLIIHCLNVDVRQ